LEHLFNFRKLQVINDNKEMRTGLMILLMISLGVVCNAQRQSKSKPVALAGTVTDTTLAPVHGALVIVDGQNTGIVTNRNGMFRMKVKPGTKTIGVFTNNLGSALTLFEGQTTQEFILDGREMIKRTPELLKGEENVNIGYGTVKKKDLNKNIGYIEGRRNNEGYTDIYQMIQGKVPGVEVRGNKITIRGVNSIMLSSDPLFVVDGVIVNSIDYINPREVKSIVILKGPEAAIYGSRASGGVIVITMLGAGDR
jgi:TonB-dependent SusC/RagA subfamily outer membrane receptor